MIADGTRCVSRWKPLGADFLDRTFYATHIVGPFGPTLDFSTFWKHESF